jgi:DNA-binding transcriptional ArsR family regulator
MSKPDGLEPGRGLSLDELIGQIDTRLEALRPLVLEYQQLESARAVLVADYSTGSTSPRAARSPARQAAQSRRAPRGANREAILRLARERPGISVSEIADATGIGKPTVHSTVYTLKRRGILDATSDGVKPAGTPARTASSPQSRTRPSRRPAARRRPSRRARKSVRDRSTSRSRARRATAARAVSPTPADAPTGSGNEATTTGSESASTE